jgi:putative tryptophan/tyrosine transport system substrate-binding protein
MASFIGRRRFLATLGGSAVAWPLAARAQQPERMRRVGVLIAPLESDPDAQRRMSALRDGLEKLGWNDGRNVRIDVRWGGGDAERLGALAVELVGSNPDVIVAAAAPVLERLKQATQTIPIVFAQVSDPVRGGFVASLARPGGNITGFALYEYAIVVKWLELLKQLAPSINRVGALYDPNDRTNRVFFLPEINSHAPAFAVQPTAFPVRNAAEIGDTIETFANTPNGGLVVLPSILTSVHRELIAALAAKYRVPAVYAYRFQVTSGGLASYGVDLPTLYRGAASYVDRILRGERPAELPVQFPTKFELVINRKAAAALGLDIPASLLARTDELIE